MGADWVSSGGRIAAVVMVSGLCTALAAPSHAAESKRAPRLRTAAGKEETKAWVGDRAITTDKSGAVRKPTREEARALVANLRAMLDRSPEAVRAVPRADGVRQVNLGGRLASVVIARPAGDGTMETLCVFSLEEATAFLGLRPETPADAAGAVE